MTQQPWRESTSIEWGRWARTKTSYVNEGMRHGTVRQHAGPAGPKVATTWPPPTTRELSQISGPRQHLELQPQRHYHTILESTNQRANHDESEPIRKGKCSLAVQCASPSHSICSA